MKPNQLVVMLLLVTATRIATGSPPSNAATSKTSPVSRRASQSNPDPTMGKVLLPILRKLKGEQSTNGASYADLTFGNPHDRPIPEYAEILRDEASKAAAPDGCDPSLFQYQIAFDAERAAIVSSLRRRRGPCYASLTVDDVFVTNGAFGGLVMSLKTFADAGDAVVVTEPDYFGHRATVDGLEISYVRAALDDANDFDLDVGAIKRALLENAPRARVLLLTSPNNPTGNMYTEEKLRELAAALEEVNDIRARDYGDSRPVVIVSDEAYHRIIFPSTSRRYVSPAEVYPRTVSVYSYAKTCMAPSERLGWLALSPLWPSDEQGGHKSDVRAALGRARFATGWLAPSGTNARCIPRLEEGEGVRVDLGQLQERRDALVRALRGTSPNGGDGEDAHGDDNSDVFPRVVVPESGFYMLVQVPPRFYPDRDVAFTRALGSERYRVAVMPQSSLAKLPGWVRMSVTASDDMIDVAVRGIRRFVEDYRKGHPALERYIQRAEENRIE